MSDEGVNNEPGEARQTAGAGPHWRQGELSHMQANYLKKMFMFLLVLSLGLRFVL